MYPQLYSLVQYCSERAPVVLLESQSAEHPASRYSYLAALPEGWIKARGCSIETMNNGSIETREANPWQALASWREEQHDWIFGFLGYDMKNYAEPLSSANPDPVEAPDLFFMCPSLLIRIDHKERTRDVVKGRLPDDVSVAKPGNIHISDLTSLVDRTGYLDMINRAKREIYEGSYYEINLSHQLQGQIEGDPLQLYSRMQQTGPVPFGAYLAFEDLAVCSLSPERFLRKEGDIVFSQPIKGTMKRARNQMKDARLKQALTDSDKDRAENLMIVDLVRNDLSRVAAPGSVTVSDLFEIQTFGTVHQMVSTVQARTAATDPMEIIKACYPMGSMTGAPKIRTMQDIEALENYRRGIYSGAIGYCTPDGDFDFSVVIRTAIIRRNMLYYAVGGAITSDSVPEAEWDETWLKAKALTEAVK